MAYRLLSACPCRRARSETCPACGSTELARLGAGTQRLERELEAKIPELERIRLDADAVERPGAMAAALDTMGRHAKGALGQVRIGTGATACIHLLPPLLRELPQNGEAANRLATQLTAVISSYRQQVLLNGRQP